ncbi:MAG: DNA mismatch repair endonuclease MutL [Kiritimatiellia bacterium]
MPVPPQVHILPDHVANKIAAGEVIERPASVLKELMENSLDAGATRIAAEIVAGGTKLIAVWDNGVGMGRDDALLCVERHATSKIRNVEDIARIITLGFRGEALAAIAAVSRFRLRTCLHGETVGTEILIVGGTLQDVCEAGGPAGTEVEVRDLFLNVPARRKFLRSTQTEAAHVRTTFMILALSHWQTAMTLTVDGRTIYELPASETYEDRVRELFGPDLMRQLRPVEALVGQVRVSGYASVPAFSRSDRSEQYVFVNGRATSATVLTHAIREAYHTLLPTDRHPCVVLFLELDPGLVDVNVHPTKKEVRFRAPNEVRNAVMEAIRRSLRSVEPVGGGERAAPAVAGEHPVSSREPTLRIDDLPPTRTFRYPRMPASAALDGRRADNSGQETAVPAPSSVQAVLPPATADRPAPPSAPWSWCRVVGQLGGLYVLLETEDGFAIMDPHAAHERVLFERFMAQVMKGAVQIQSLLIPETIELLPHDAALVRHALPLFVQMGFGIAEFGGDTFVLDAVPACFAGLKFETFLTELARHFEQAGARGAKGRWQEEAIAQAACKAAVRARDRLSLREIEQLVIDLASTEMPYTCPHGRPTLIFTSFRDLDRKFGRT